MRLWFLLLIAVLPLHARTSNQLEELNSGWPEPLLPILQQLQQRAENHIAFLSLLPENPIDHRTNEGLRNSFVGQGSLSKLRFGHEMIGWSCKTISGTQITGFTALTGETDNKAQSLVDRGWGLSVLFADFQDGFLQSSEDLTRLFQKLDGMRFSPRLYGGSLPVSQQDCLHLLRFVYAFKKHPNQPERHFGFLPDPRKFEGGGCGSFSVAGLSRLSLFYNLFNSTRVHLKIPVRLLGRGNDKGDLSFFHQEHISHFSSQAISPFWLLFRWWGYDQGEVTLDFEMTNPEYLHFFKAQVFAPNPENQIRWVPDFKEGQIPLNETYDLNYHKLKDLGAHAREKLWNDNLRIHTLNFGNRHDFFAYW